MFPYVWRVGFLGRGISVIQILHLAVCQFQINCAAQLLIKSFLIELQKKLLNG